MQDDSQVLKGLRVLIVEDELIIAMDLQCILEEHGCEVLATVSSVGKALDALATLQPDVVSLDLNLNGEPSLPVAEKLRTQGVPFVVTSGYANLVDHSPEFSGIPLVRKPFDTEELLQKLVTATQRKV